MSTNAVNAVQQSAYYTNAKQIASQTNSTPAEEELMFASQENVNETESDKTTNLDYACMDGNDDGKLGAGEVVESIGKGILKSATNMIKTPFTEAAKGNYLPALAVVGGALLCITPLGAPLAVIGGTVGLIKGVSDIAGGVIKANDIANSGTGTDGEAKAAFEQVGSGVLTTGLSATAVIGGVKTMKGRAGSEMNNLAQKAKAGEKVGITDKAKAFGSDTIKAGKDTFGKLTGKSTVATAADAAEVQATDKGNANANPDTPDAPAGDAGADKTTAQLYKTQPTDKTLTVEQAQAQLDDVEALMQDRSLTKADYKAAKIMKREAQANLDYAKVHTKEAQDLAAVLKEAAEKQQATQILEQESVQTHIDEIVTNPPAAEPVAQPVVSNPAAADSANISALKQSLETIVKQGETYGFKADVPQNGNAAYSEWLGEYNNALSSYESALKNLNNINQGPAYSPSMTINKSTFANARQAALNLNPDSATITEHGLWIVPSFSF